MAPMVPNERGTVGATAVDSSILKDSDDGYADATYEGRLFTGVAFENDPATGQLIELRGYRHGKAHGPFRAWYRSGQICSEMYNARGRLHGPWREWYEDGHLSLDSYYEYGFRVRHARWAEGGALLESEQLLKDTPAWGRLEAQREEDRDPVIDIDSSTWEFVERPIGWGRDVAELPDGSTLAVRRP